MYRIDNTSASASLPIMPPPGAMGYFFGGNPATGQPATIVEDWWMNTIQEEIIAVIAWAGITLDKANHHQLLDALQAKFCAIGAYLPLIGGTLYGPANGNLLHITVDNGHDNYIVYTVSGTRAWYAGVRTDGVWNVIDQTSSTARFAIDTMGNASLNASVSVSNNLQVGGSFTTPGAGTPVRIYADTGYAAMASFTLDSSANWHVGIRTDQQFAIGDILAGVDRLAIDHAGNWNLYGNSAQAWMTWGFNSEVIISPDLIINQAGSNYAGLALNATPGAGREPRLSLGFPTGSPAYTWILATRADGYFAIREGSPSFTDYFTMEWTTGYTDMMGATVDIHHDCHIRGNLTVVGTYPLAAELEALTARVAALEGRK